MQVGITILIGLLNDLMMVLDTPDCEGDCEDGLLIPDPTGLGFSISTTDCIKIQQPRHPFVSRNLRRIAIIAVILTDSCAITPENTLQLFVQNFSDQTV